jgi:PAS domain S-box-containing protein
LQKLEFEIQNEEILQADQILQSDEVKYRSAIENMLDTFYEATIHGILLDISPSIQIISKGQYTRAELIGKSLISFYSDQNERDSFLSELFKHGKVTDYELKILNKDGSVIPVAISSSLLYENGIPVKITGIMRDITERKLTENALLESERRYRSLADSGQALIWTATPDKKCNYFNQVWLNFTGRTMAQENGDGWAEGVHPDDLDRCFEIYSTFFDRREPFSMDYRLRHHDGEYRWLQDNGTPQFDSEGLFVGYIGHCLDISELKLAEEALRRSEEKYRNIFINAQEGVFQTSVDGTYISINPALAKMYGFDTPEELMNSRFDIAQDAYSDPRERENFIRLMEDQGFVKGYEYEVKQKDGQKVWFYEDAKAIKDEQGKILFFEGFVVDITERKQAEVALNDKSNLLTNLIINLQEGILLEDSNRKIALTNQLFCAMFGILAPPEALIGADCSGSAEQSKMFFKNPVKFIADMEKILADKKAVYNDELELADGRYFERDYIPTYLENKYSGHLWKYRDISERKHAALKLEKSENRFSQVVAQSCEVVWEVDALGLYTYMSPLSMQVYGYTPGQMVGKLHFYDIAPEEVREEFKNAALHMFSQKLSFENLINSICRADGKVITVTTNGLPILNEDGSLIGYRGIDSDITERLRIEDSLKNSEKAYRFITERSNDLIYVLRIKPDMGFEYVGPSAERITGFTPEEHYNDPQLGMKLVHPDDKHLLQAWQSGTIGAEIIALRWVKKDGSVIWTESENIPIYNEKGDVVSIQGKATDITERKQAELIVNARLRLTDFAATHSRNEMQQKLLDELEHLTGSGIGFFHAVDTDQKTLVLLNKSSNTTQQFNIPHSKDEYFSIEKAGFWIDCINQKKAVIQNDFTKQPSQNGLPEGHAPLLRLLALPVLRNEKIVAIVGVGNKLTDYGEKDVELVARLSDQAWDIMERKGAEESLKKLSQAVEQSPEIIYITNSEGLIEYANPKAKQVTGYTDEELIGQNPRIFSSGEKPAEEYKTLWQTINAGGEWKGEFHNKKKSGELYWVAASISPVIDTNGKITHYLAIEEDITERKKNDEKITMQNERLNAIVSAMPDLIFVIDTKGTYLEFYQSNANKSLIPVGKVIGTNLRQLFNSEQAGNYLQNIRSCIQDNKLISFEYRLSEENSIKYYEARLTPCGNDKVLSFVRDVTDRVCSQIEIQNLNSNLELKIVERTSQLTETNRNLVDEIEERKRVELALIESEKSYRTVVENVNEIIFQTDADGLWIFLNKSWENVTGFSVEESLGKLFVNYVHPDDRVRNWELFEPMMKRKKEFCRHQVRYLTNDGGYRWVEVFARLALNEQNEITGTFGTLQDITERMEAEAALTKSMELLDESQKLGHVGGWEFNTDTLIQNWTEEVYRIHEVDFTDKITVENGINFYTPASIPVIQNALQRAIEYNESFDLELAITTAKGNLRSVKAIGKPDLEHHRIFGFFQDITDRKLAEDALRQSESKHSSMISNISDVIGIIGIDGLMKYKSPNISKDFGWQPGDLIGTNGWLTVHPDDLERIQKEFYAVLQKENAVKTVEYKYLCKDGSYKPIELTAINLINDKVINGVLLNYHDITARRLAEEEIIKARNEAEKANLAKSEFLSRMSHELRTPMNSILGFAQLMEMGELIPAHKKGVNHILKSGKHLLDLINEVLDISKIEAGYVSLLMEPVQLNAAIKEMMAVVQHNAAKLYQTLELKDSPTNTLSVKADQQRLKQVLLNLINNAVNYNHPGGSVVIKTELLQTGIAEIPVIRVSVTDTGIGISHEDIQKLFLPFERVGAEKTEIEGTGLGLTVVKKLMDVMGGNVGVVSTPGEGSTFWIELPMVESTQSAAGKNDSFSGTEIVSSDKSATILYFEDNSSNVELVEQILGSQRPGIRLISTKNGDHSVDLVMEHKPDLVLLDLNLPGIHGSEVLKLLQAEEKTKAIPVVIISADAMPHQLQRLIVAGAKKYLTKPLDVIGFLKVVDEWIGKGIQDSEK